MSEAVPPPVIPATPPQPVPISEVVPLPEVRLDAERVVATVDQLCRRIQERFPTAGLNHVSHQLLQIARRTQLRAKQIARPLFAVRFLSAVLVLGVIGAMGVLVHDQRLLDAKTDSVADASKPGEKKADGRMDAKDLIQVIDAGFNVLVLTGAMLLFLMTLERRIKRGRALRAIHELRSLAHIIDMHQLTKDPERVYLSGANTQSSPKRTMSSFELNRYLDYCSEMLALSGKIAVLYVQDFADAESVAAVNDLEDLTSGLSRKIWQKIMILHEMSDRDREHPRSTVN